MCIRDRAQVERVGRPLHGDVLPRADRGGQASYRAIVQAMVSWRRGAMESVGTRCAPFIRIDLNDKLGYARDEIVNGQPIID
eukprot:2309523-Pyramimonas_sp.AAC.1